MSKGLLALSFYIAVPLFSYLALLAEQLLGRLLYVALYQVCSLLILPDDY